MPEAPARAVVSTTPRLPDGFQVTLDRRTLRLDAGRLLVGGSPMTVLRLSSGAASLLRDDRVVVTGRASALLAERLVATNLAHPYVAQLDRASPEHLTVVVPVRDRPEQLDRCLSALRPMSVIVVDDASHDPGAVAAVTRRHGATLVSLDINGGPAAARNAGLARVQTPIVAFVDSDVEATGDALLRLGGHLTDPSVALVGPRVDGHTRTAHPRWFERYDAAASSLTLGTTPCAVRPGAAVAWLPSACLVARTASLGEGFDPVLHVGEDVDLVWRLLAEGHRVRYEPGVTVRHDVRPTMRGWLGRKVLYGSGSAALGERHGSHVAPAILSPTMALAGAALLLRRRWSLPLAVGALAVSARTIERAMPRSLTRPTRVRVAGRLAVRGAGWSLRQQAALLLRHWWPAAAIGCLVSAPVRRAVTTALVVDTLVAATAQTNRSLSPMTLLAGRRLDDLAYGTGLWWGALRSQELTALRPRRPTRNR
ncbi:MAG: mycofactocin biosynthesis glycosyltransferase MftF [Nocardioides sp.]|uniref:mycofactocin biosynthesis glycosyltransferase MftF n=1 Tax=Nocardioides sp. TaxID=35761 RepID=UPI00239F87FF|nr:mycofactocin biosynthesis glycosyltransferase MftF [Nocardioides sp.]MDE0775431.1 mycofactocin biosynthesis glycosyltransferase MftF [Nocardioides sp.]